MQALGVREIVEALSEVEGPARDLTIRQVSTDSRALGADSLFVAVPGDRFDGHDFVSTAFSRGAVAALVSRDVKLPPEYADRWLLTVPDTVEAYGRLARAYRRRWGGPVVAVTGSNGKTTSREMLAHLLGGRYPLTRSPKSFNNEIGVPYTLFTIEASHELAVVEMGTNAPGEIDALAALAEPNYGLITNVGHTHLAGLGSVEGVARAKGELLDRLQPPAVAFLNADCRWFDALAGRHGGRIVSFGRSARADVRCVRERREDGGRRFWLADGRECFLPVPGPHNVMNALAALAVCRELDCLDEAVERLRGFELPDMRFQVRRLGPLVVIEDCYNANICSMLAALDEMDEMPEAHRRLFVCGDMLEMGRHAECMHRRLGRRVAASKVDRLFTVGSASRWVAEAAHQRRDLPHRHFANVDEAAPALAEELEPGDLLLVKGSRGNELEKAVEAVRRRWAPEPAPAGEVA